MSRTMRTLVCAAFILAAGAPSARAAVTALVGATVHPVSGPAIPNAVVLVEDGRIAAVGANVAVPADAERVDLAGLHLYPGMIAANTVLGLAEVSSVAGTVDVAEGGTLNPNARAIVAVNPDSEIIPVTRANGVLTVVSATTGGVLSGTSALWNLDGWTWEEMRVREPIALHLRWPGGGRGNAEERNKRRDEQLNELTGAFADARAYAKAHDAGAPKGRVHERDVRWEAMLPAIRKEIPVFVHANQAEQIEAALDFAEKEDLRIVIVGGKDAPHLADRLAAARVPVIVENVLSMPNRTWEPYDAAYTVAARLHEAGVPFCISTGDGAFSVANLRNLPYEAAMAAAYGLPAEEALKAVTLYPARILGVDERLGSIEPGKDANLIATDGDPLEIRTQVLRAWIGGRAIDMETRHTRFYERYRNRPRPDGGETKLAPSPAEQ